MIIQRRVQHDARYNQDTCGVESGDHATCQCGYHYGARLLVVISLVVVFQRLLPPTPQRRMRLQVFISVHNLIFDRESRQGERARGRAVWWTTNSRYKHQATTRRHRCGAEDGHG